MQKREILEYVCSLLIRIKEVIKEEPVGIEGYFCMRGKGGGATYIVLSSHVRDGRGDIVMHAIEEKALYAFVIPA
jgi:hypothetical protein